jgi:hypothetical protein
MANPSIRGHQAQIKFFQDGQQVGLVNFTSFNIKQDSSFMRAYYTGAPEPEGDQAIEGWSGDGMADVKDASIDTFIDALVTNNLNGIGVSDYTMTSTELYNDGTTKSYVYYDGQFKMGRKQEGLQAKITKNLDFQFSGRKALS